MGVVLFDEDIEFEKHVKVFVALFFDFLPLRIVIYNVDLFFIYIYIYSQR